MSIRTHDPYSGYDGVSKRDLEAEAAAALAEITGDAAPVPCVMCSQPEESHIPGAGHPYMDQRPGPQRKPKGAARKPTTRKRSPRTRKTPPPKSTQ